MVHDLLMDVVLLAIRVKISLSNSINKFETLLNSLN